MKAQSIPGIGHNQRLARRGSAMYAISFDLDTKVLEQSYPTPSWQNAYADIGKFLRDRGFDTPAEEAPSAWQQGSVYFGGDKINAVTCVLAALDLSRSLPWFAASVRDIRMMRIEELNDLMPAVQQGEQ